MRIGNVFAARIRRPSTLFALGLCLAIIVGVWSLVPAGLVAPRPNDRHVTNVVMSLIRHEHLSKHTLDDEISQRGLQSFLRTLDPMKMYFYQSDVDEFMKHRNDLDDMLKKKDISFAYTVFHRFLARIDERVKTIDGLLEQEFDFTLDEEMLTDRDLVQYAGNEKEALERWQRRIKYDLLVLKGDKKEGKEATEKLSRRYHSFARRMHQTDADELLEWYLTAITSSFDPHTTYMSPSTLENFRIQMRLELEGIGAALQPIDGYTVVSKIIPGGAADKHGKLKPEDRIVSVGQDEEGEMVDVVDMKLSDVVQLIRGDAGTVVRLGVIPAGGTETSIYTITRAKIELTDSEARGEIIEEGKKPDGSPLRIGVVDLPSFYMDMEAARSGAKDYKSTTVDVKRILENFNEKKVDVVVLDLRRNGGGSLTEAIELTGLFIDSGTVVQVKDSEGEIQEYDDRERGMSWGGPLVVLTSKFSASASEILAGAVQDYRRGLVLGDSSTHGKGTVQSLLDLGSQLFRIPNPPNLGALKITMQQFYRPNGDSTQQRGVHADVTLPSITDHMDVGEADLDYAIEFEKVPAARYLRYKMVAPEIIQAVASKSQARISESEDFAKLVKNIERYKAQKEKKKISLNEKEFFAERAELDAEKEEEKQLEEQVQPDDQVVTRDFYFNEVLAVTADYFRLLQDNRIAHAQRQLRTEALP
ncbi:MAG: carboxy terminal-processing peptidase [Planctomycetes bacterium]|nr:carboxy terminal-processing peptidase [Planctomycetota bacterium]MBL7043454.1 carboxy terminal-processing peptidase [Pirellulaceae bacterium]